MTIEQARLNKILEKEFTTGLMGKKDNPDNILNNFNFDLVVAENKIRMDRYKTYSNKKNDILYVDFFSSDPIELDKLFISIETQKKYYNFDYCFVNPSTLKSEATISSFKNTGILVFENIKLKEIK